MSTLSDIQDELGDQYLDPLGDDEIAEAFARARLMASKSDFATFVKENLLDGSDAGMVSIPAETLLEQLRELHSEFIGILTGDLSIDEFLLAPLADFCGALGIDEYEQQILDIGRFIHRLERFA